jgi:hypothetical protein
LVQSTESAGKIVFVFVTLKAEGLDKETAAYNSALSKNSLLEMAKASILFDETPHTECVRVNATYK